MNGKQSKKLRQIARRQLSNQMEAVMRHLKRNKPKSWPAKFWLKLIQWVLNR